MKTKINRKTEISIKTFIALSCIGILMMFIFVILLNTFNSKIYEIMLAISFGFSILCCIIFYIMAFACKFEHNAGYDEKALNVSSYKELINVIRKNKDVEKVYDKFEILIYK